MVSVVLGQSQSWVASLFTFSHLLLLRVYIIMPPAKPKPSEIAAEAKKQYIPWIRQTYSSQWPSTSYLCPSESMIAGQPNAESRQVHFGESFTIFLQFVANSDKHFMSVIQLMLHSNGLLRRIMTFLSLCQLMTRDPVETGKLVILLCFIFESFNSWSTRCYVPRRMSVPAK